MIDPKRESMLIEQVLAGRTEVFAELVDVHKNKIYGLLRSMGAGHQDAQDYTQEAFVKAYRKLASYRLESSFASWLYTIAVNVLRDAGRRKSFPQAPEEEAYQAVRDENTPERALLRKETRQEALQLVRELPEQYRLVFLLRYTNELSYDEIGSVTGLTVDQVRNRLHRARKQLQKKLKGKEGISREMLESCSDGRIHS